MFKYSMFGSLSTVKDSNKSVFVMKRKYKSQLTPKMRVYASFEVYKDDQGRWVAMRGHKTIMGTTRNEAIIAYLAKILPEEAFGHNKRTLKKLEEAVRLAVKTYQDALGSDYEVTWTVTDKNTNSNNKPNDDKPNDKD